MAADIPARMRAIQIDGYGGPEAMVARELPVPACGPDDLLVRLAWSGINFMDVYTRLGRYAKAGPKTGHYETGLPLTLGIEGAGVVVAVGERVQGWRAGDRAAYALARGSYAEYAAVPARQAAHVPPKVGLDTAAALLFQGLTAHYLVHDVAALGPGRSCLVHSAAGGVGQIMIQLAKALGATVVATASSPRKRALAQARGADVMADVDPEAFVDAVMATTGGAGVDVVLDSIGAPAFDGNLRALRRKGLFVHYGANGGALGALDPMRLADGGSLFFTRPRLADHIADAATVQRRADDLFAAFVDGVLRVEIAGTHGFGDVAEAQLALQERRAVGKSLLRIDAALR